MAVHQARCQHPSRRRRGREEEGRRGKRRMRRGGEGEESKGLHPHLLGFASLPTPNFFPKQTQEGTRKLTNVH